MTAGQEPWEAVVETALGEVGYLEKASNTQLEDKTANAGSRNFTKYARDLDDIPGFYNGKKQGSSWCDVFVDWCFVKVFGWDLAARMLCQPIGGCGAGVLYSARYFQAKGRLMDTPQVGDQIFFGLKSGAVVTKGDHTGIVTAVAGGRVYTVEGNTSGASGVVANGGGVCRKSYALGDKKILGYGRPDWALAKTREEECDMTKDEVKALVADEVAAATAKVANTLLEGVRREVALAMDAAKGKIYHSVDECPSWARAAAAWAVESGYIRGDEKGDLGLDDHKLWALQVLYNMRGRC